VVKHPKVEQAMIKVPVESKQSQTRPPMDWDPDMLSKFLKAYMMGGAPFRREVGDWVNLFWPNLFRWSCMLWDPKGFPTMLYELNKYESSSGRQFLSVYPWVMRIMFNGFNSLQSLGLLPKSCSKVKDMKKMLKRPPLNGIDNERSGILEYLEDISKTDEHYFRIYENSDCVGFENIGVAMASHVPPAFAGYCETIENNEREWNAIETRCMGLGEPYCEFKLVPGEIPELKSSLELDSLLVEKIHQRLIERLTGFLLDGKPLVERPRSGNDVHLHVVLHGMGYLNLVGEKYRRAQMMGAARSAKVIGARLLEAGLSGDEAIKRVIDFMNYCKVGKVIKGETIRINENCESLRTTLFGRIKEPSCYFTTGFFNGLFSAVIGKHVREKKCVAAGDPYCEWEIM
jgi:predicted hydrocarbon binding protein